ncbi:MAG: DUF2029 domain-containing protein [Alphaproteobacteria bacterium]|nr:DUF2029 domain-containing protein [Alphaproteobacteria bacterium]
MTMPVRLRPLNRWLEPLFALAVAAGVVRAGVYFYYNDHLPQPFFYEPFDTWMDWFNTAYWAYETGAYDAWGSVYPPLSFVFLRIFSLSHCYQNASGYAARECDWFGLVTLHSIFLLNIVLLWLTFRKVDRQTAPWRTIALGLSLPALFGLERGNLIVVTFTCCILGFGPLLKSARLRWLAVGMGINFKIYVVAGLFPQLLRRRWRWFEGAVIATVVVYLVTYAAFGAGSPRQIYDNITYVTGLYQAATFLELWYTVTYQPLVSLLTGQTWMVSQIIGSRNVDLLAFWLPLTWRLVQLSIAIAAFGAWLRPEVVPMHRLTFLGLAMVMITAEPGGYTECILIFFVFLERWKGFARCWSIFASYVLCLPFDIILDRVPPMIQESYLAGHATFFNYYVTLGPFIRPALVLSLALALSLLTIRDVWVDIRQQGWRSRWRYRRDVPLLPGVARPVRPANPAELL